MAAPVNRIAQRWRELGVSVSLEITSTSPLTRDEYFKVRDLVGKIEELIAEVKT